MRSIISITAIALTIVAAFPAVAQTTGTCDAGTASADLDIGNVRARMFNSGSLFWIGGDPVYEVPKGSGSNAVFASGIWVGGMADGELRMAGATYSDWEFWPGPLDEQGNPPADCSVYDHIFLVDRSDLEQLEETGEVTDDIRDWPWQLGAPVTDGDGNPDNYDIAGGDRPDILGDQMAWWVMNDVGNVHEAIETPPIGLEIQVSAFAFARDDAIGNTTFYRYRMIYRGFHAWTDAHFGLYADIDLGNSQDDYVGSDSLRAMGYVYNGDDFDESDNYALGYGFPPPALGYQFLRGPLADNDLKDNDYDGVIDEAGEYLRMTSFVNYHSGPSVQGDPVNAPDYYGYVQALWRDGVPITVGGTGRGYSLTPTRFMYSGNPPEFWTEDATASGGQSNNPSDRNFVIATGPFTMQPADTTDIWLAIIWSRGVDRLDSVRRLKTDADTIQAFLEKGLATPQQPPATAPILLAPVDNALAQPVNPTLHWNLVPGFSKYEVQIDDDADLLSPLVTDTALAAILNIETSVPSNARFFWRVRAISFAGPGPWSDTWTFDTDDAAIAGGYNGLFTIQDSLMFVEVAGPDDRYACGPNAGSTFGCEEVGGNFVYASFNGAGNYIMYHEGTGPEGSIAAFAPHDFEIRFTETGSYAYHPFTTGNAMWVPFEVWDIGPTYTGTPVNPNDPADDVRMIPVLFAQDRDECTYEYYDNPALSPFGVWSGTTQRIYAYYPTTTYADWEAAVKPLVDLDPSGCPNAFDETGGAVEDHIAFGRDRPLQRIIFEGDPASVPPHPAFGVVVRFYTQDPIAPSVPIISAPLDGAADLVVPITLAWNSVSASHRVQVSSGAAFPDTLVNATTPATFYRIESLPSPGTYYWRVNATDEGVISDWSAVASFSASVVVGTEDDSTLPDRFALEQNYPNPFNPSTTIRFALPSAEHVTIDVYDVIGRRVARFVDDTLPAGNHETVWNAGHYASGVYLYKMTAGSYRESRAMLLIR